MPSPAALFHGRSTGPSGAKTVRARSAGPDGLATHRSFRGPRGGTEHFFTVRPPADLDLAEQIAFVATRYAEALRLRGLAPETAIFRRLYVSDALNQKAAIQASGLAGSAFEGPVAVSLLQQRPLPAGRLALAAYHIECAGALSKHQIDPFNLLVEKNGIGHLWTTGLTGRRDAATPTADAFGALASALTAQDGSLAASCLKTWITLPDMDSGYRALVAQRATFFERHGLTRDTHYLASTCTGGGLGDPDAALRLDAWSIPGLAPTQVRIMNALGHLCEPRDYGIAFERGTRVAWADRTHHILSGTASIDRAGKVLHEGDTLKQLARALENAEALLKGSGARLEDLMQMTVFLRDPNDAPRVAAALEERLPEAFFLLVEGAICRPEWLVEVEGLAITPSHETGLPPF